MPSLASFSLALAAALASSSLNAADASSSATLQVCNRGFCYTKKEDLHRKNPTLSQKKNRNGGLDFCQGGECELYSVLATELYEELEAVECLNCPPPQKLKEQPNDTRAELIAEDSEILDDLDLDARRSWTEEPKKGSCYDEDLGYLFDCNLIKILDDGLVLIEDLKSGGAFAAQPSTFHLHKNEKKKHETHAPNVVVTGEDPTEDFRTIVEMNMMGI